MKPKRIQLSRQNEAMSPHSDNVLRKACLALFVGVGFVISAACVVGLIYGVVIIFGHIFKV